jgi:hypothetical protein
MYVYQDCQQLHFHTKYAKSGTFWKALGWKSVAYFVAVWYLYILPFWHSLWPFGILVATLE